MNDYSESLFDSVVFLTVLSVVTALVTALWIDRASAQRAQAMERDSLVSELGNLNRKVDSLSLHVQDLMGEDCYVSNPLNAGPDQRSYMVVCPKE